MTTKADFIATLTYRTTENGGRSHYAATGYRPAIKFSFDDRMTSGEQKFLDKEMVYPGETVLAEIRIVWIDIFKRKLKCGTQFEFYEGARMIGTGEIIEVINEELLQK